MALEDAKDHIDRAITARANRGYSFENAFAGVTSFLRRRYSKELAGVDVAVTGIPFDSAVTHRPGTRFGPRAIREASALQAFDPPYGWEIDPIADFDVIDHGDLAWDYADVAAFPARLTAHAATIVESGASMLSLGGDHFISYPILKAHAAAHGPLSLIQFDAHSDTWADDNPARIDHGTMFYKAVREGLVVPERSVQIGIRTTNPDTLGVNIIDAPEVHRIGPAAVVERVREIVGSAAAYLTFDIDALDPAFAPGTGTPVWGGLTSAQAAAMLRGLAGLNIVGGDVVEVSPPYDTTGATAIAGAHVAVEILCLLCMARTLRR